MSIRTLQFKLFLYMLAGSLITGCFNQREATRYYTLGDTQPVSQTVGNILIALGPMEIPEYLNRQEIVIRKGETSLTMLRFDRWAEPLDVAVKRHLSDELNAQLEYAFVFPFPALTGLEREYQVSGIISAFEADEDGNIRLTVRWGIIDKNQISVIRPRKSVYTTVIERPDDIPAVAAGMTRLLDEFAADIAAGLESLELS